MLFFEAKQRIWLYTQPTDMRKSFNALVGLVRHALTQDPLCGDWFVFINRRKTHIKILYFDGSGFCIWMKRLAQGMFHFEATSSASVSLTMTQLTLILEGIRIEKSTQYKRYSHARAA